MDTPGDGNRTTRRTLTVAGALVGGIGAILAIVGFVGFLSSFGDFDSSSPVRWIGMFAAGAFMAVIGLGMLNAGTVRLQAKYLAEESAPAARTTAEAVGEGLRGAGVHHDCTQCGTSTAADARFCSNCGHAMS
ncbi:MAG: zinc-ribbon domain-containing protein [Nocardioidaceae bacterium]